MTNRINNSMNTVAAPSTVPACYWPCSGLTLLYPYSRFDSDID